MSHPQFHYLLNMGTIINNVIWISSPSPDFHLANLFHHMLYNCAHIVEAGYYFSIDVAVGAPLEI